MKSIVIISLGYPTHDDPSYAFIQPIAHCFADSGLTCTVIAPQSLTKIILGKRQKRAYQWIDKTAKGNSITVFQPAFISASNMKFGRSKISSVLKEFAVKKCYEREKIKGDIIYAHFWECGIIASRINEEKTIPVFVASGESKIDVRDCFSNKKISKALPSISGVICVSSKNLLESKELGLLQKETKTIVIPNGYNPEEFYFEEKKMIRKKLGIAYDEYIAIFVGSFIERKGPDRVIEASKKVPNTKLIMVGWGNIQKSDQIIFQGKIPHNQLVHYLNAADVFVLPTLAEGCCNAIVEALACGLPIISSDYSFNYDILNNENAILIDPKSIEEIASAIQLLSDDLELRKRMSINALETAKGLSISERAAKILEFINDTIHRGDCSGEQSI